MTESSVLGFFDFEIMYYVNNKHEKPDQVNHSKLPIHQSFAKIICDEIVPLKLVYKLIPIGRCNSAKRYQFDYPCIRDILIDTIFHPTKDKILPVRHHFSSKVNMKE